MAGLLATVSTGCGNYSNEDLDFQLALPEDGDIEAKMQAATVTANPAEYYNATRVAVKTFNTMAVELLALVEAVRKYSPSERHGNQRIWGPFPNATYPDWELRVVMERSTVSDSLLHMDYSVDVRQVGQGDDGWVAFLAGNYTSQGGARHGQGAIELRVQAVRDAQYPVDGDSGLRSLKDLTVSYDNASYPVEVVMDIVNVDTADARTGHYEYHEQQDGSGRMEFDWQGLSDRGTLVSATMVSQWIGSGAGRGDLVLVEPNLSITLGTDCWGADGGATYSKRIAGGGSTSGASESCLF
jgi:hypothetical protein